MKTGFFGMKDSGRMDTSMVMEPVYLTVLWFGADRYSKAPILSLTTYSQQRKGSTYHP